MNDGSPRQFGEIMESFSDPPLTQAEQEALFLREDKGIVPAPMRMFEDVISFRDGSNNFFLAFAAVETSEEWYIKRRYKAFQRFAVLNPDLEASLTQRLRGQFRKSQIDDPIWEDLYRAYGEMSQLVDVNDKSVVRDGFIDEYFLCR